MQEAADVGFSWIRAMLEGFYATILKHSIQYWVLHITIYFSSNSLSGFILVDLQCYSVTNVINQCFSSVTLSYKSGQ